MELAKDEVVKFRATAEELSLWEGRAGAEGVGLSEWIRRRLNGEVPRSTGLAGDAAEQAERLKAGEDPVVVVGAGVKDLMLALKDSLAKKAGGRQAGESTEKATVSGRNIAAHEGTLAVSPAEPATSPIVEESMPNTVRREVVETYRAMLGRGAEAQDRMLRRYPGYAEQIRALVTNLEDGTGS